MPRVTTCSGALRKLWLMPASYPQDSAGSAHWGQTGSDAADAEWSISAVHSSRAHSRLINDHLICKIVILYKKTRAGRKSFPRSGKNRGQPMEAGAK